MLNKGMETRMFMVDEDQLKKGVREDNQTEDMLHDFN